MIKVRKFNESEFPMINEWHREYGALQKHFISPTSYVAEVNEIPVIFISLILTNCAGVASLENLIGNPTTLEERKEALPVLIRYVEEKAIEHGVKTLFMSSIENKLKEKYQALGYELASDNLTMFFKHFGGN